MFDWLLVQFPASGVETYAFFPFLVALVVSFFTSMGGISGAFLLLPFQVSVLGFNTPSVSATNFLYNVIGTPGGIYRYAREGRMDWNLAGVVSGGLIPGIFLGYYLRVVYLPDPALFKAFAGLVLAYLGVRLLVTAETTEADEPVAHRAGTSTSGHGSRVALVFPAGSMAGLAFGVGVIGGAYGVGGGAIMAPFCVTVFRLPVHGIAGAVLFSTLVSSVAGVAFYSLVPVRGMIAPPDWALGLVLGAGGLAGTYLGARMQKHVSARWIRVVLGLVVVSVAAGYLGQFVLDWGGSSG